MQKPNFETLSQVLQQISEIQRQQIEDRNILNKVVATIQKITLTKNVSMDSSQATTDSSTFLCQIAHDVTSVVGLKEAITWKSKFLKCIWTIALCAGVIATAYFVFKSSAEYLSAPTATRVEMVSKMTYEYPPILVCPNLWIDTDKALSLGLSLEGLKYSLGYVNYYKDKIGPDNIDVGLRDFFSFYEKSDFASIDDYLMAISVDVRVEQSIEIYDNAFYSSAYCPRCNESYLPKVVTMRGVCYNFQMEPEIGRGRLSSVSRFTSMQLWVQSRELINDSLWGLYVSSGNHFNLKNPVVPQVYLKEFAVAKVRFMEQHFHMTSHPDSPCRPEKEFEANYTSTVCVAQCLSPLYSRVLNCTPFESTIGKFTNHPRQLCNTFANVTWFKLRESMKTERDAILNSKEAKLCYKNCPYTCERTRYERIYEEEFSDTDHSIDWTNTVITAHLRNATFADIYIENAASYQGGILTLWEINTISFIELISNVGGTLGLFVGCTMMTFVQIVLCGVKYLAEEKKSAAKINVGK